MNRRYAIIGAGPAGLAAARNFKNQGLEFVVFERRGSVGGIWNYGDADSPIYQSTSLISSKPMTAFRDFPMPEHYPDYPSHRQALEYLRAFAVHHDLERFIRFNCTVRGVKKRDDGWSVAWTDADTGPQPRTEHFDGLVLAHGFNNDPKWPSYPGHFAGEVMHSAHYRTPAIFEGKRVLVVGGGNSGCDIAVEAGLAAVKAYHSVRKGYYYIPKFFFGVPADQVGETALKLRVPLFLRRLISGLLIRIVQGVPERFGLAKPDHRLFESHPIVNSQLFYALGHGRLQPKPDVRELRQNSVAFTDGSEAPVDLIVYATGFRYSFPFLSPGIVDELNGCARLDLNIFSPQDRTLAVIGMINPDSGVWRLMDRQAELVAKFWRARELRDDVGADPEKRSRARRRVEAFERRLSRGRFDLASGIRFLQSARHAIQVEHFSYARLLGRLASRV